MACHRKKGHCYCKGRKGAAPMSRCGGKGKSKARKLKGRFVDYQFSKTGKVCHGITRGGKKRMVSTKKCARHFARTQSGLSRRGRTWPPTVD